MSTDESAENKLAASRPPQSKPEKSRASVWILLVAGIALTLLTAIVAFDQPEWIAVSAGALLALIGISLTFLVARRQDKETAEIQGAVKHIQRAVTNIHDLVLSLSEKDSEKDYLEPADESDEDVNAPIAEGDPNAPRPRFEREAVEFLQSKGADLDFTNLKWRPKTPSQKTPGNHGWFVESPDSTSDERWFVRKARGMTVRKAMPRTFLEALKAQSGIDPRSIKLDFQIKPHGLAAWYARTYDNQLWKVWKSNRNPEAGIQVEKVAEDE